MKNHQQRKTIPYENNSCQKQNLCGLFLLAAANASSAARPPGPTPPPAGMALVAAGSFDMGDTFGEGSTAELPVHTVYVSAFYMDQFEITKAEWDVVYNWAVGHGYTFDYAGSGKAADHPVHTINWYDAVKWSNARSEMEKRTPAYCTDARLKKPYRSGQVEPYVNWNAGYRLPGSRVGEGGARWGERASVLMERYGRNHAQPGKLRQHDEPLRLRHQLRHQPHGGLSSRLQRWRDPLHESGRLVSAERLRAIRHGR
jgi:formylglycine-generating enzyme required for sulfatase activity